MKVSNPCYESYDREYPLYYGLTYVCLYTSDDTDREILEQQNGIMLPRPYYVFLTTAAVGKSEPRLLRKMKSRQTYKLGKADEGEIGGLARRIRDWQPNCSALLEGYAKCADEMRGLGMPFGLTAEDMGVSPEDTSIRYMAKTADFYEPGVTQAYQASSQYDPTGSDGYMLFGKYVNPGELATHDMASYESGAAHANAKPPFIEYSDDFRDAFYEGTIAPSVSLGTLTFSECDFGYERKLDTIRGFLPKTMLRRRDMAMALRRLGSL